MSRVNERRSILPLSGKERASSPGGYGEVRPFREQQVPVGLERLLGMAAADPEFARALGERRSESLEASGVTLTPAEEAMLAATPAAALGQLVASVGRRLADEDRRAFLASAGAALLLLAGCKGEPSSGRGSAAAGPAASPTPGPRPEPMVVEPSPAPMPGRPMSPVVAFTGSRPGRVPNLPPKRRVRLGPGKVRGALDKAVVRRVLRRHLAAVDYCYLSKVPPGKEPKPGSLWVSFAIGGTGKCRRVKVSTGGLSKRIGKCVAKVLGRVVYPAPADSKPVHVRWKLIFK